MCACRSDMPSWSGRALSCPAGQRKYQVARRLGELNSLLRDKGTILLGPGRWGTTTPSLGVPVHFMEINRFDCIAELAYSSHGLRQSSAMAATSFRISSRPERFTLRSIRARTAAFLTKSGFRAARMCAKLLKADTSDPIADVISVYDLGEGNAILYSEVESQECFLAKV